jgi:hypothetical protein
VTGVAVEHLNLVDSGIVKSPSTSPPPQAPKEEYMIDGFDHDDSYRMVEDELRAVASHFTAHLHAAEYQRLKTLARSQNAETIRSISRPVSGRMTDPVRRRKALAGYIGKRDRGVRSALGQEPAGAYDQDDEDDEPTGVGSHLQGLMNSPSKSRPPLSAILPSSSRTSTGARGFPSAGDNLSHGGGRRNMPARRERSSKPNPSFDKSEDGSEDGDGDGDLDQVAVRRQSQLSVRPQTTKNPSHVPALSWVGSGDTGEDSGLAYHENPLRDSMLLSSRRRRRNRLVGGEQDSRASEDDAANPPSLDMIPSLF